MAIEITRQIPIGELVMNYPQSVEVLFNYGFHCIGCGLSAYETLEQGAAAHGFDDEAIDRIVEELREAAGKPSPLAEPPQHCANKTPSPAEDTASKQKDAKKPSKGSG